MTFDEYQRESRKTAIYPNIGKNFVYPTLGLAGEAGEVAEKVKKIVRDKGSMLDDTGKDALKKELGDVLWYVAQLCSEFRTSMDEVASENLAKLRSRQERSRLHGSGDHR